MKTKKTKWRVKSKYKKQMERNGELAYEKKRQLQIMCVTKKTSYCVFFSN